MADVTTNQILENGISRAVVKVTDFSPSGDGLTAYKAVDAQSAALGSFLQGQQFVPGTSLVLSALWWNVIGMVLRMEWEATIDVELLDLQGSGEWGFRDIRAGFGGIANPKTAGSTGSILFTTEGQTTGSSFTVIMGFVKGLEATAAGDYLELNSGTGLVALNSGAGVVLLNSSP